jgi:hypothetical protein
MILIFPNFKLFLGSKELWIIILGLAFSLFFSFWYYRRTYPPLNKGKKIFLLTLRAIAFFCLFLVLAEPVLSLIKKYEEKPVFAVLADFSQSMNFKFEGKSRGELEKDILNSDFLDKLPSNTEVANFGFSDTLFTLKKGELPDFSGNATAIGEALKSVKQNLKEKNLNGIILLSDGVNNLGEDPVFLAQNLEIPVYTVGLGEYVPFKDLALEKVDYNQIVYVGSSVPIKIILENRGYQNIKIPIFLREKGKVLDQKDIAFTTPGQKLEVTLNLVPDSVGLHQYEIFLPIQKVEYPKDNNRRVFTLKVLKSKIKVLLLAGKLNWEYSFLKKGLAQDSNIQVFPLIYGKGKKAIEGKFPANPKELNQYDLLILLDPPAFLFSQNKNLLSDYLYKNGGGVLFFWQEALYSERNWEDVFQFIFGQAPVPRVSLLQEEFNLQLTSPGELHPITRLKEEPEENKKSFSELPPLIGLIAFNSLPRDFTTLAVYKRGNSLFPAVSIRKAGLGKLMSVNAFPFWRWDFLMWGMGKDNQPYLKFLNNAVRWLLVREDLDKVNINPDKLVYKSGEKVVFQGEVYDESYQKITNAEVKLEIHSKEKTADTVNLILNLDENGNYFGEISGLTPGKYTYRGEAKVSGKGIGEKRGEFTVEEFSLEQEKIETDFDLLKRMAEVSGGKFYLASESNQISRNLKIKKLPKENVKEIQLWNNPWLLAVFVLCLSMEWWVRKKSQLL